MVKLADTLSSANSPDGKLVIEVQPENIFSVVVALVKLYAGTDVNDVEFWKNSVKDVTDEVSSVGPVVNDVQP